MRKLLVAASLLLLTACGGTPGNMGNEVYSWFGQGAGAPPPSQTPPAPMGTITLGPRAAKVAVLLPMSGSQAALGKNMLDAAQLAVLELGNERFELMPRDSGTVPEQAAKAAHDAIAGGAQLIIGPLFANSVKAVKVEAAPAHVPVLSLSNDWTVAGNGAFVMGFSPVEQARRIAAFAASRGLTHFGVLAPSTGYGDLVIATLKESGTLVETMSVVRYQNTSASIALGVEELVRRRSEYQALFLPAGGADLRRMAALLTAKGLGAKQVPWLGTGLWDEAETLAEPALEGGWYAAPDPAARVGFAKRYESNFGKKPARLASLAYDATALAEALAQKGRPFDETTLTNPNGFAGLDGIFRLTPSGVTERGLAILEVSGGSARVIESAPEKF